MGWSVALDAEVQIDVSPWSGDGRLTEAVATGPVFGTILLVLQPQMANSRSQAIHWGTVLNDNPPPD
jgi:hypothetical protein